MWFINGDVLERQPNSFRSRSRLHQRTDGFDHLGPSERSRIDEHEVAGLRGDASVRSIACEFGGFDVGGSLGGEHSAGEDFLGYAEWQHLDW
jgi:hypothetical protein